MKHLLMEVSGMDPDVRLRVQPAVPFVGQGEVRDAGGDRT